jgi:hypothetical protein
MRHLLIVGRHLDPLIPISVELHGQVHVISLAVVDDIAAHVQWCVDREPRPVIVCLEGDETFEGIGALLQLTPPIVFLAPDTESEICRQIMAAGGLVLSTNDDAAIILATLVAFSEPAHRVETKQLE